MVCPRRRVSIVRRPWTCPNIVAIQRIFLASLRTRCVDNREQLSSFWTLYSGIQVFCSLDTSPLEFELSKTCGDGRTKRCVLQQCPYLLSLPLLQRCLAYTLNSVVYLSNKSHGTGCWSWRWINHHDVVAFLPIYHLQHPDFPSLHQPVIIEQIFGHQTDSFKQSGLAFVFIGKGIQYILASLHDRSG